MDYLAIADLLFDTVEFADGAIVGLMLAVRAAFAYSGIRLWTDNCMIVSNAGADYYEHFKNWIETNKIATKGIKVKSDFTNHFTLSYRSDGSYEYRYGLPGKFGTINFGYLRISIEDIVPFCDNIKGMYLEHPIEKEFFKQLIKLKKQKGFKLMWEIQRENYWNNPREVIEEILPNIDIFSINSREGRELLGSHNDEETIEILKSYPTPCFFRVGAKGSYMIMNGETHFVPSISLGKEEDPTGCGNSSTATALYAFCEGYSSAEIAVMCNITAAYNVRQYGLIPKFSDELRAEARSIFSEYCKKYV